MLRNGWEYIGFATVPFCVCVVLCMLYHNNAPWNPGKLREKQPNIYGEWSLVL